MIRTKLISVPKKTNGSTTIIKTVSSGGAAPSINPVYLWGNYFDGTSNVNGSMNVNGNIFTEGDIRTNTLYVKTLNLEGEMTFDNLTVDTLTAETVNTDIINADSGILGDVTATTGTITTLNADTGILGAVTATTGNITNLTSTSVSSNAFALPTWTIDEDTNHNLIMHTANDTSLKIKPNNTEVVNINDNNIGFNTNLSAYNFASGASGWKIFSNGNAEFQNIKVNGSFDAYTITYNNIRATNGIMLVTDTGFITAVEEKTINGVKYYIFTISEYPPFAVNDYVLLQYKVSATSIKKFKGIVRGINLQEDGTNTVRVAPYNSENVVDTDTAVGQYLTRVGNYNNTNRQTVIKLNPYDGGYIDFLKDLNSGSITADEDSIVNLLPTACRIGNLAGITYNSQSLSGYGLYADNVYLTGAIGNVNNKWRLNNDGSGQLANNHISWTANGALTITLNNGTEIEQYINNTVGASENTLQGEIDDIKNDYVTKTEFEITTSYIGSKVEDNEGNISTLQQTVNGLTSTVSSHTTSISTLDGEVTTNTSNISTLQQTVNGLTSTVSSHTTSINTLDGEVTTNTSNISQLQQTANGLTSTVSSHTTSINTLDGEVTTNTNNISQLQQTSTQISSRVSTIEGDYVNQSTLQQTANSINARVDNLKVGGTNLLMGTQNYNTSGTNLSLSSVATVGPDKRNDCTVLHCPLDTSVGYSDAAHWSNIIIDPDTYYTLSFYAYANSNNINITSYFYHTGGGCVAEGYNSQDRTTTNQDGEIITTLSQTPTRYWVVWKTKTSVGQYESLIPARLSTNSGIHIWGVKLEKGNMATDWSPSPDEYATHAEISVEADNIKLAVYNELNQSTGIDVQNGTITLDADNTTIEGNLDLKDATNGITLYENVNGNYVPRINLQQDYISEVTTITTSDITREYNSSSNYGFSATNSRYETSLRINTISLASNEVLDIDYTDLVCQLKTSSSGSVMTSGYPTRAQITYYLTRSGVTYTLDSIYANYYNSTSNPYHYISENSVRFAAPATGSYVLYMKFTMYSDSGVYSINSSYPYAAGSYKVRTSKGRNIQTYIGRDGMYAHAGGNKIFYAGQDELRLQYGLSGIRWINDNASDVFNGSNSANKIMQVAASTKNTSNSYSLSWLPFYNFTPVFEPTFTWETFTVNGTSVTGYLYRINPQKDNGICIASNPNGASSTHYIMLPPDTYTQNGNTYDLPEGYTVNIVKCGFGRSIVQTDGNFPLAIITSDGNNLILDTNGDAHVTANMNSLNNNYSQFVKIAPRLISGETKTITWLGLQDHN